MLVAALAVALTLLLLLQFLAAPRPRWNGVEHDRNGHYSYGLKMALALEHGQLITFFSELEKGKTWPPLHGLLVAFTQVLSGNDWRAAVLPGLLGWATLLISVFIVSEQIVARAAPQFVAGSVAFVFAALSPAHRGYAIDFMLESLGSGLTAAVLAAYTFAAEARTSANRWRLLALMLTLLFFEKYNYWLIVALAIAGAEISQQNDFAVRVGACWRLIDWKRLKPWIALLSAFVFVISFLSWRGPTAFDLFGRHVSLYPPGNLVTAAYALLCLCVALEIRRTR
ncbi:MAG: hypothetical protein QOD99_2072 [Chthoniobacter sp.]|jgi:hypothetical protein|nr:hypothetical protein [Chthoniobacter sp.]